MSTALHLLVLARAGIDPLPELVDALQAAIEEFTDPPDEAALRAMIAITATLPLDADAARSAVRVEVRPDLFGEDDGNSAKELISAFVEQLRERVAVGDGSLLHVLKFLDTDTLAGHEVLRREIHDIEMRLREALSFVFLNEYPDEAFAFLNRTVVKVAIGENPQEERMRKHAENQLFYILFSEYPKLNDPQPAKVEGIVKKIREAASFDAFKELIEGVPVRKESHADFIQSLRTLLGSIDEVRNCVAHNRTVPQDRLDNYRIARPKVVEAIDRFWETVAASAPAAPADAAVPAPPPPLPPAAEPPPAPAPPAL